MSDGRVRNPVEVLYDTYAQREWERQERHRTEFAVTLRALRDYLPRPPAAILDIGGGPGRYAITLTQWGYEVTLLDLSQNSLVMAQTKAAEAGVQLAATVHGNALDLPPLPVSMYGAVLLLGPLYHLLTLRERETAVANAQAVLKPGGVIFAAFITRFAPFRDMASKGDTHWIVECADQAESILRTGQNPAALGSDFPDSYFAHPQEVRPLMEAAGFTTLNLIALEGVVAGHEEHINRTSGELWQKWVELNYQLGQDPALWGAADHLLYVGRKEE